MTEGLKYGRNPFSDEGEYLIAVSAAQAGDWTAVGFTQEEAETINAHGWTVVAAPRPFDVVGTLTPHGRDYQNGIEAYSTYAAGVMGRSDGRMPFLSMWGAANPAWYHQYGGKTLAEHWESYQAIRVRIVTNADILEILRAHVLDYGFDSIVAYCDEAGMSVEEVLDMSHLPYCASDTILG